jgi:uncharacterized protein (TIGR03435 family)
MRYRTAAISILLFQPLLHAQQPAFEVASLKVHPDTSSERRNNESIDSVPGRLTVRNASLASCLKWAYDIRDYQISGPAWLQTEKYDIDAKAADATPLKQLRLMLQTLLAERLSLAVHRETRDLPEYALVAAKSGPKLHKADADGNTSININNGSFVYHHISMPEFAANLSTLTQVDRPVLDRTGIAGVFDFSMQFGATAEEMKRAFVAGDGPSIFTVIQEQLGLRLEAQKGPVEMLVIDRAEKTPTEN